jgi:hypothetical protein
MLLLSKITKGVNFILDTASHITYRVVLGKTVINAVPQLQSVWTICSNAIDQKLKEYNNDFTNTCFNIKNCMQNAWNWEFLSTENKDWIDIGINSGIPGLAELKITGTHLYLGYLLAQFNTGANDKLNDSMLKYIGTIGLLDFATWYFNDNAQEIEHSHCEQYEHHNS